jgi:hypothetical protein
VSSPSTLVTLAPLTNMDRGASSRAVAGVARGHQARVKTWYEAVMLYNGLHSEGNIHRVPA